MQCNLADAIALVIPPFLAYDQAMTRPALILLTALALTGCTDVAVNVAINVGPVAEENLSKDGPRENVVTSS